jgi:hypothetical protein
MFLQAVSGLGDRMGYLFTLLGSILLIVCATQLIIKFIAKAKQNSRVHNIKIIFYFFY